MANYDPKKDPIVGPGPKGTGTHRTKSGKLVNSYGQYVADSYGPGVPDNKGKPRVRRQPGVPGSGPSGVVQDPRKGGIFDVLTSVPPPDRPLDIRGIQAHLKSQGYDIRVDNKVGPQTLSALADYLQIKKPGDLSPAMAKLLKNTPITGRRNPDAWNTRYGSPKTRPVVMTTKLDKKGNPVTEAAGPMPARTDVGGMVDMSALFRGVSSPGARAIPATMAAGGAKLFDPAMADRLAAAQFDGEISEVEQLLKQAPRETAQHMADVGNWYGQVLGSQKTAATRDAAINQAGIDSIRGAGGAILSAIGGEASEGAGSVGAANAAAVGTLEALGANQEAFNADLRPLLEAERAAERTRESVRGSNRAKELADRVVGLKADRGRAKAGFEFDIGQANNQILDNRSARALQIREQNNGLAQQEFQNALALANAQLGAAVAGVDIQSKLAKVAQGPGGKPKETSYPFAKAPVSQRNDAYNQALSAISNGGALTTSVPRAVQLVNQVIAGYGWSRKNPAVMALRNQILMDAGIRPDPRWR